MNCTMLADLCPCFQRSATKVSPDLAFVRVLDCAQILRLRSKLYQILCCLCTKLRPNFGRSHTRLCTISFAPCPFLNLAGTQYMCLCVRTCVTMVWRWCDDGVTMVWRWCDDGVTMVWRWCDDGVWSCDQWRGAALLQAAVGLVRGGARQPVQQRHRDAARQLQVQRPAGRVDRRQQPPARPAVSHPQLKPQGMQRRRERVKPSTAVVQGTLPVFIGRHHDGQLWHLYTIHQWYPQEPGGRCTKI